MNALNKLSKLWRTSVNRKARPAVEGEHNKSWNHGSIPVLSFSYFVILSNDWDTFGTKINY